MQNHYDAIIIGAGIIGTAIARALAQRGWRILGIDQLAGAGQGSTSGSVAMVRTQYSTREGTALAWEGYHCWSDWPGFLAVDDQAGIAPFHPAGVLTFKTADNDFLEKPLAFSLELGIPFEQWPVEKLATVFPSWDLHSFGPAVLWSDPRFGEISGESVESVFFPCGGYCSDPRLAAHNLQRAAEHTSASFRFNQAVCTIDTSGGRVSGVTLASGERLQAPVVVNAAGAHSGHINNLAGIQATHNIKTRVVRHETVHLFCPEANSANGAPIMLYDTDLASYIRPDLGQHILAGSFGAEGEPERAADPDDFDRNLSQDAIEPVYRLAQRIPALGIPNTLAGAADLWDVSDDWIPIYDRSALDGFYLAIGTSGNQFKTAPAVGELMAALIEACENGVDHDCEPVQFHLPRTGHNIGLGFFSRNRTPILASSHSVLG